MKTLSRILGALVLSLTACQTSPFRRGEVVAQTSSDQCRQILASADWSREVTLMASLQDLFEAHCDQESIQLGGLLREALRDKYYSFSDEILSILGPEEMNQTYVLESHERVYVTVLMAMSSLRLGKLVEGRVELRRASDELNAILYNHGRDRVTSALIASLGEENLAAPFWRFAGLEQFSEESSEPLKIYAVGHFDGYNWRLGELQNFYKIEPKTPIPRACVSQTGALVPIEDWVHKIQIRHRSDYHPLLNFKSYVRLPVGIGYGAVLAGSGVGIAVLGCGMDSKNSKGCESAIQAGAAVASLAPNAFEYPVQPDLRHWPSSPVAFLMTRAQNLEMESCRLPLQPTRSLWAQQASRSAGKPCVRNGLCRSF